MNETRHAGTAVITGATSGVGKAMATGLSRMGYSLILPVRNTDKAMALKDTLEKKHGNYNIHLVKCDIASLESVRSAAEDIKRKCTRIDILSLNAAILSMKMELTKYGLESIIGVNYFAHFLLVNQLLDLLKKSAPARVVTVTGGLSMLQNISIDFNDLQSEITFNPLLATVRSATAKTMFAVELAERLKGTGVTSTAFHPGLVKTELSRNLPGPLKALFRFGNIFLSSKCRNGIFAATADELNGITGKMIENKKVLEFEPKGHTKDDFAKLWEISEKITGLK